MRAVIKNGEFQARNFFELAAMTSADVKPAGVIVL